MIFPHGVSVTRLRPLVRVDGYGDEVEDWSTPERVDFTLVAVHPSATSEDQQAGRESVLSGLTIYLPFDADVTARDRFEVAGVEYVVEGESARWQNPWTGWAAACVVSLARRAG